MIDFNTDLGKRAWKRLQEDFFLWLTTVGRSGVPYPRPVWFIWEGETFLIYSQPQAKKLQHIQQNPYVAVHFDGGVKGLDVQVFQAVAEIVVQATPADQVAAYMQKYGSEIRQMGATEQQFSQAYRVAIRIRPTRLRGIGS